MRDTRGEDADDSSGALKTPQEDFFSPMGRESNEPFGSPKLEMKPRELGLRSARPGEGVYKLVVFLNNEETSMCQGFVGSKKEKFCTLHPDSCAVGSHSTKGPVRPNTVYVAKSETTAMLEPSLLAFLAEKSAVFQLHGGNVHPMVTWKALFDCIVAILLVDTSDSPFITEDDSKGLIEESIRLSNPTPKRVRLTREKDWRDQQGMDLESCIKSSKEAFEKAEAELSKLHTSLTLVASLTGRPKRDVNDGSAWAAIERMDDRIDALDSDLGTTQMEVGGARDGLRRCETSVSKIGRKTERVTQYVRSFEQFGAVDKIRTLEGKVTTLSSQNAQLASDMHRLVGAVSSLMDRGLSGERPVGIDTLPNARLEALERSMAAQITEMKALVSGSGILRFGKWNLDGVASC